MTIGRKMFGLLGISSLLLCGQASGVMAQSAEQDQWQHKAAIYLWGADIGGTTGSGQPVDIGFSDLVDNLEAGFMFAYKARKNKWSFGADLLYLDVSKSETLNLIPPIGPGIGVNAEAKIDLESLVVQGGGAYNIYQNEVLLLDVMVGARYLDLSGDVNLTFSPGITDQAINIEESLSDDVVDGIVGLTGSIKLGERWTMPFHADVGTGDSDITWQAFIGIKYRAWDLVDFGLAYRHLDWDIGGDVIDDISFGGPQLGVIFRF